MTTSQQIHVLVQMRGTWIYQLTPALQEHLRTLIAGKSRALALALLRATPGITPLTVERKSYLEREDKQEGHQA